MMLCDRHIRALVETGPLVITPFDPEALQPSSYDITLSSVFRRFQSTEDFIDVRKQQKLTTEIDAGEGPFMLGPNDFVLGSSVEKFGFPDNIVGRLDGKSSLGRLGLLIHSTAGFFDPGFQGTATLELSNVTHLPIALYPGMKIGQMSFLRLSGRVLRPYGSPELGSKYQEQNGPTESLFHLNEH